MVVLVIREPLSRLSYGCASGVTIYKQLSDTSNTAWEAQTSQNPSNMHGLTDGSVIADGTVRSIAHDAILIGAPKQQAVSIVYPATT